MENDVLLRHHRSVLHRLAPEVLVSGKCGKENGVMVLRHHRSVLQSRAPEVLVSGKYRKENDVMVLRHHCAVLGWLAVGEW